MAKTRRQLKSRHTGRQLQRGQVLIIVVFAITALVAFVGLVIDLGLVFIQYGRLRRSVDSAALAASLQYRENYTLDSLTLAAEEFLRLNGITDPDAVVTVCDVNGDGDADDTGEELVLCDENADGLILSEDGELRKFVHVVATSNVQLAFLPVIGIRTVHLAAEAISEAASLDVVLLIDRSESMTFDAALFPADDDMRDPRQCNMVDAGGGWVGACSPFDDVKHAAYDFVNDHLFFPYDRVAIITFDRHVHDGDDVTVPGLMHLSNDENAILTNIKQLTVYDPQWDHPDDATLTADPDSAYLGGCEFYYDVDGPCRYYDAGTLQFVALDCKSLHDGDPSPCTTTNTGGGLYYAGGEFAREGSRPEALWVTILISDGLANSSIDIGSSDSNVHCPGATHTPPYCHDGDTSVRHCQNVAGNEYCLAQPGSVLDAVEDDGINDYDTDDFARDMADFVGIGQQSLIFTIGLGPLVTNCTSCVDNDAGEKLLQYVAEVGNGVYFEAPSGDDLEEIFREIADKIAVRLTH